MDKVMMTKYYSDDHARFKAADWLIKQTHNVISIYTTTTCRHRHSDV